MAKYIELEEAIFRLSKWLEKASDINNRGLYNFGEIAAYQTAIAEINSLPAADVAPVVRGKWLTEYDPDGKPYCLHCSVCDDDFSIICITTASNFCPNCGARMDGDADA